MTAKGKSITDQYRYGIGEWYGRSFIHLVPEERRSYAEIQSAKKGEKPAQPCLPRQSAGKDVMCTKAGGVCTLRLYRRSAGGNNVEVASGENGTLRTTCPYRFQQFGMIFEWIGQELLQHQHPIVVGEIGFLQSESDAAEEDLAEDIAREDVGRIDNVLIHPERDPLAWCAMEIQAVYFSGPGMSSDFRLIQEAEGTELPFPTAIRRPDYRSSGPKRLMPQLQIKVPSLRRWGKKMAVVIDREFYNALGKMDKVKDVSNCDIAWFVVKYDESGGEARMVKDFVQLTTLERAVEGLTAGKPVSLESFEARIRQKMKTML